MLISDRLLNEINSLKNRHESRTLEAWLLKTYEEFVRVKNYEELAYIVSELAHFYELPATENVVKAEHYYLELESLMPGAESKWRTAAFLYRFGKPQDVIKKVDEIDLGNADRFCTYSALTLKGQACIALSAILDARRVLDQLIEMATTNPRGLPYGDEMNLMEAAVAVETLRPRCCELLGLVVPKIRDQEFRERGDELLKSCAVG